MRYELFRSQGNLYFSISGKPSRNFHFPLHFHKSFELLFVEEGEQTVHIDGIDFRVCGGECALILPGQFHSYRTQHHSVCWICIFSADFLPDLDQYCRDIQTHHPVFCIDDAQFHQKLWKVRNDVFAVKSKLYDLAARYVSGEPFCEFDREENHLFYDIAQYINEHFTEPLTLHDLAEQFGYNYRYMSGIVNRCFHLSFSKVLRQYRIDHACRLLKESEHSITDISSLCGFDTTRNFNQSFKDIMKMTPKEYRKQNIYHL